MAVAIFGDAGRKYGIFNLTALTLELIMTQRKAITLIQTLLVVFVSCTLNPEEKPVDQFVSAPDGILQVGRQIQYRLTGNYQIDKAIFRIVLDTVMDSVHYRKALIITPSGADTTFDTAYYSMTESAILFHGSLVPGGANPGTFLWKTQQMSNILSLPNEIFPNGRLVYEFPMVVGKTWNDSDWMPPPDSSYLPLNRTFLVSAAERITVPSGTFNCFRIDMNYSLFNNPISITDWVAKEGLIKRVIRYATLDDPVVSVDTVVATAVE